MDMNQIAASVVARATGPYEQTCNGCGEAFTTDVRHPYKRHEPDGRWLYWNTDTPVGEPGDAGSDLAHDCKVS